MQVLNTIFYIFLFIICLSVLIVVHELGHLIAAKIFGVYCHEFSIGMGPKIIRKKRKNGETYFALRCIPFGGYVSMHSSEYPLEEGQVIPENRCFDKIKKWKRAIILFAGVFMNAVLALGVFFCYECFFEKTDLSASVVTVQENSESPYAAQAAGMKSGEMVQLYLTNYEHVFGIDDNAIIHRKDSTEQKVYVVLDGSYILGYDKLSWSNYLHFCIVDEQGNISYDANREVIASEDIDYVSFVIKQSKFNEETQKYEPSGVNYPIQLNVTIGGTFENPKYVFENLGLEITALKHYNDSFGTTIKNTFVDFGEGSIAIIKGLGSMFTTREGFEQAGGIIAIANETTNILKNYGLANFVRVWGLISVNLAIINLLPFPGLDGWQLLVLIVEGVAHKEIPQKVKGIMSLAGMVLLFAFMIFLIFKDVGTIFF